MDERIDHVISELKKAAADASRTFASLNVEQLNWCPAEKSWSVGQCLEHIIRSNEMFYPEIQKMIAGTRKNSLWENVSPFTGWGGRFLIKAVSEDSKKAKAPSKKIVPPSGIDAEIVPRFAAHLDTVAAQVEACSGVDRKKTVITSPFLAVFTYTLDDGLTVLVEHTKRHIRQAKRVLAADGFRVAEPHEQEQTA
ncbi:MAG: DinB family protein [Pyrinomonadaceae bacterium]